MAGPGSGLGLELGEATDTWSVVPCHDRFAGWPGEHWAGACWSLLSRGQRPRLALAAALAVGAGRNPPSPAASAARAECRGPHSPRGECVS